MKKVTRISVLVLGAALMGLFACQKKQTLQYNTGSSNTDPELAGRSTGGTSTGGPTLTTQRVLGASVDDYIVASFATRNVFMINAMTFANINPPYLRTYTTGKRYFCVGAYGADACVIDKTDALSPVTLSYYSSGGNYSGDLKLGSTGGADFLPNEIEMTGASTSNVYAISGNTVYLINNITAGAPYATAIFTIPTTTAQVYHVKTICRNGNANELKIIIAKTALAKGSTVNNLVMYTLSNLSGSPVLTQDATVTGITYSNDTNLSSYYDADVTNSYHIVIGNATAQTGTIYEIDLSTNTVTSSVGSFPASVNDCATVVF